MGIEYKIKFQVANEQITEDFLKRISIAFENEVAIALENDGFYFCDNCSNPDVASNIFYRLVSEALAQSSEVTIHEL